MSSRAACQLCSSPAKIKRPKNGHRLCVPCFLVTFETEVHQTIVSTNLFHPGERIAIGASGGKDSTVLASVLKTLNERYNYGVEFILLSIDEGIKGYRDHSLDAVKRNAVQYEMKLEILGYDELYGWTMDQVVSQIGKKGNCTYCGVFRRQALDRGAEKLGIKHVVTGHNADDIAETVLMNLLRGDLPRLYRCTAITTSSSQSPIARSKPLKYAYQKEIVLYAHHKKLDYFTTECIYSPEAFRGNARDLIKNLEKVRPSAILDIVRSGEAFAAMATPTPTRTKCTSQCGGIGCPSNGTTTNGTNLTEQEGRAQESTTRKSVDGDDDAEEPSLGTGCGGPTSTLSMVLKEQELRQQETSESLETEIKLPTKGSRRARKGLRNKDKRGGPIPSPTTAPAVRPQVMGNCIKCGYLSSQSMCQACTLLEGLNKSRAQLQVGIEVDIDGHVGDASKSLRRGMEKIALEAA